jgi:hypothetical protein
MVNESSQLIRYQTSENPSSNDIANRLMRNRPQLGLPRLYHLDGHSRGSPSGMTLFTQTALTDFPRRLTVSSGFVKFHTAVSITSPSNPRFWVPSPFQSINSEVFLNSKQLQFLTFEFCSQLQQISSQAFRESDLTGILIPASVKILCELCFQLCTSLKCVTFESESKLERSDDFAFQYSRLQSIVLPRSLNFLGKYSFSLTRSLFSVIFESGSRLPVIEKSTFWFSGLETLILPSSVEVIRANASRTAIH